VTQKLGNSKGNRKILSMLLALVLMLSQATTVWGANLQTIDTSTYQVLEQIDFENGQTSGFVPGSNATATVEQDNGNHYLKTTGTGSGSRSIVKTLAAPTSKAQVLFSFDWKPETVSTALNSSEVQFSDSKGFPLFRLVKAGGADGAIRYGAGTSGTDLTATQTVTGVTYNGSWLSAQVLFDFADKSISLEIHDKDNATNSFTSQLSIGSLNYANSVSKISIIGNRYSGNDINFTTCLDKLIIRASEVNAPAEGVKNVISIATSYKTSFTFGKDATKQAVITNFPTALDVVLEGGQVTLPAVPVVWSSNDYIPGQTGTYTFTGALNLANTSNVANPNNVYAQIQVVLVESTQLPVIEGYESLYYGDFGDSSDVAPVNWGFTTSGATLSKNTADVGGNVTSKLSFFTQNQSGGRVATKKFDKLVTGSRILLKFDWYPGEINDKGNHADDNGGEFRVMDSSNNIVFTLNQIRNAPMKFFAGNLPAEATGFSNPLTWYTVELLLDLQNEQATLKLTDKSTGQEEQYTTTLTDVVFDGFVSEVKLVGVRTAGNNITWTTYLDNLGVYNVAVPDNWIIKVDKLPYRTVYVNQTTAAASSIGLPQEVSVTLANTQKKIVAVKGWKADGKAWNPSAEGIYKFSGELEETQGLVNGMNRQGVNYVYNRLTPPESTRQTEWLDRGVIALKADNGTFISWRLLADEYAAQVSFNIYRNGTKLNQSPLTVTNYSDAEGKPGDVYKVETLVNGASKEVNQAVAASTDYLSIPMQKPEGGTTATGDYTYSVNDSSIGDLDGDGEYEVIVKWYPSNAIDSSQNAMTGPTLFDAYKLDGTLLWRMDMGLNLTSGAHYNQFIVADFDGDGKSEMMIKTADGTTVYGATDGKLDKSKVISVIGNPDDKWVLDSGHIGGGPEYMTLFKGDTGKALDTVDYAFPLGDVASWGDTWHNRSDRFLAGLAYLDGKKPSAVFGRGYYERTTFVAYGMKNGKLEEQWTFDSYEEGRGSSLGYHSLATADVDNDGKDEIIAGSLTLDHDGSILYAMDGAMGREMGSHGDALHVGAFDPAREGIQVFGVHEVPAVASLEYHDAATGETLDSYYAYRDTGRGLAANITSSPGYEYWAVAGDTPQSGGAIYNVQGGYENASYRNAGLSVNFALYWDGDLLHELLDGTSITKYKETTGKAELLKKFEGVASSNGTKATPTLQADILGDWREEVLLPTTDSTELRIFSTTIPTEYRMYTLMHDSVYRNAIGWQNTAYNQPPHIGFYLGEDIRNTVLAGQLKAPKVNYTNKPSSGNQTGGGSGSFYGPSAPSTTVGQDGSVQLKAESKLNEATGRMEASLKKGDLDSALEKAKADSTGKKSIILEVSGKAEGFQVQLPVSVLQAAGDTYGITILSKIGKITLNHNMLIGNQLSGSDTVTLVLSNNNTGHAADRKTVEVSLLADNKELNWSNPEAPVKISVPYELQGQEKDNHELLAVVYVDEAGNRTPVYNGRYVPATGTVDFTITHFSKYAISYAPKSFTDTAAYPWAAKEIGVLAAKGIINGTSDTLQTFDPAADVSRADFTVLLVKTLGLQAEVTENFKDVGAQDYYYEAVGIAKTLGIATGQGEGVFNPRAQVSRQDMMVLTARAMDIAGLQLQAANTSVLNEFTDKPAIADYAAQAVSQLVGGKLISGYDGQVHPLDNTTRVEAAVFLYRIYNY
jgi:hypothetical protein